MSGPIHADHGQRTVVAGLGMASVALVEQLLRRDVQDITVVAEESVDPYNRILLSAVLEGTHRSDAIAVRTLTWFAERGVHVRVGTSVATIDRDSRSITLSGGERVPYDRLVLATGSIPELPPIRGLVTEAGTLDRRVHAFRTLADCDRLLSAVPSAASALVVGGGLLGLQVARALSIRGLRVEVIEVGEHVLRHQVDPAAGAVLRRSLADLGTAVYTGARATRLTDAGLRLDNGHELDADLIVLTAGSRPRVRLASDSGLVTRRGIVVDDALTTSDPSISAIGDCAEHDGRTPGLVPPAWEQARVLADRLAGGTSTYTGHRPVARLRATGLDVAVLGDPSSTPGEVVQLTNPISGTHQRLVVDDGRIVAATLVGDLSRVGIVTQAFDRGTRLAPGEPGELLLADRDADSAPLPDEAEVCACAGVSAGRIRACGSIEHVREETRATTGCGGCLSTCQDLLAALTALDEPVGADR